MEIAFNGKSDQGNIVGMTDRLIFKTSPIHGTGGFARLNMAAGTRVIEYIGRKVSKNESQRLCELNNEYVFSLDEEFDIDGSVSFNPARFVNHSCEPNCEAIMEDGRIWIVATRDIRAGEEITYNYGYDLEDYHEHPCRCGSAGCVGYIVAEELFDCLRRPNES